MYYGEVERKVRYDSTIESERVLADCVLKREMYEDYLRFIIHSKG